MFDRKGLLLDDRPSLSPQKQSFSQPASRVAALLSQQDSSGSSGSAHSGTNSVSISVSVSAPAPLATLEGVVRLLRPTALIGAASVGGAFNQRVLSDLTRGVQEVHGPAARPLVLALSNPTSRAECTYTQANEWTQVGVLAWHGSAGRINNAEVMHTVWKWLQGEEFHVLSSPFMPTASS